MGLKKFANGFGVGLVMGPIVTCDTKIDGKLPLSASLRWVPSIAATHRLKSTSTVQATATLAF